MQLLKLLVDGKSKVKQTKCATQKIDSNWCATERCGFDLIRLVTGGVVRHLHLATDDDNFEISNTKQK